jgi:hypothetical protein
MNALIRTSVALVVAALAAGAATIAQAEPTVLTPVTDVSALSAGSGWVTWSERQADGKWHLVTFHEGERAEPRIAPRTAPFDADIGTDAKGKPVVTYSRCNGDANGGSSQMSNPFNGQLCRIRVLDLSGGTEARIKIPTKKGVSDTTPSMHQGNLAFGRMEKRRTVARLYYLRRGAKKLAELQRGTVTKRCKPSRYCTSDNRVGYVEQLDLSGTHAAFLWRVLGTDIIGVGGSWELRRDRLKSRTGGSYEYGVISGTGGGRLPVSPNAAASGLWFVSQGWSEEGKPSSLVQRASGARVGSLRPEGLVWQLAVDGGTMYSLRGPDPDYDPYTDTPNPCTGSLGPCHLVSEPLPVIPLTRKVNLKQTPVY